MKGTDNLTSRIFLIILGTLILNLQLVKTEYTWNGTDWVWNDEKDVTPVDDNSVDEGSGDSYYGGWDDDEGYDDGDFYYVGSGDSVSEKADNSFDFGTDQNYNYNYNYNNNNNYDTGRGSNVDVGFTSETNNGYGSANNDFSNVNENDYNDLYVDPPTTTTSTSRPALVDQGTSRNEYGAQETPMSKSPATSFFAQPGTLAAVVGGAVVGLLCAILCVMFIVYRMRKKDEGSYALDEPKRAPNHHPYSKQPSREFFA